MMLGVNCKTGLKKPENKFEKENMF